MTQEIIAVVFGVYFRQVALCLFKYFLNRRKDVSMVTDRKIRDCKQAAEEILKSVSYMTA
jgi:hypothetical protein